MRMTVRNRATFAEVTNSVEMAAVIIVVVIFVVANQTSNQHIAEPLVEI